MFKRVTRILVITIIIVCAIILAVSTIAVTNNNGHTAIGIVSIIIYAYLATLAIIDAIHATRSFDSGNCQQIRKCMMISRYHMCSCYREITLMPVVYCIICVLFGKASGIFKMIVGFVIFLILTLVMHKNANDYLERFEILEQKSQNKSV